MQFSGVQLEIQFQIAVRIPNSIQNAKKMTPREGLRLLPEIFGNAVRSLLFDWVPPSTTMWLELDIDSYERTMYVRHTSRLRSRLIQATPAALTIASRPCGTGYSAAWDTHKTAMPRRRPDDSAHRRTDLQMAETPMNITHKRFSEFLLY